VARRRDRVVWWKAFKDERQFDFQPLDFSHRHYLTALGVAREQGANDELVLDEQGLAGYTLPAIPVEGLLIQPVRRESAAGPYTVMGVVSGASRIDPVAAQWLWKQRTRLETDVCGNGIVTRAAWCTHCGRHFEAGARLGELREIRRWCDACKGLRSRHNPQMLPCRARDCDHWFRPVKSNQDYCSAGCEQADRRRRARTAREGASWGRRRTRVTGGAGVR